MLFRSKSSGNGISSAVALDNVLNAELGGYVSIAMRSNGDVYTWGSNTYYVVGNGNTSAAASPVKIPSYSAHDAADGSGKVYPVDVGMGYYGSYVLMSDGSAVSAGHSSYGEYLGQGAGASSGKPGKVKAGKSSASAGDFTDAIGIGRFGSTGAPVYLIKDNGTVWTFGRNSYNQFGNGMPTSAKADEPVRVGMSHLAADKYLYSVNKGGKVTIAAPGKDSFNLFDIKAASGGVAKYNWQTYRGKDSADGTLSEDDIISVNKVTGEEIGRAHV